uniref:Uncharacterized protein n=1 Tax=Tetraselmis sp. GSL018 TaxID=582737 RepID=A0A061QLP4_9CHLO
MDDRAIEREPPPSEGALPLAGRDRTKDPSTLKPPSMDAIVKTHIDQMPPTLSVILRCASIFGVTFNLGHLQRLVPATVAGTTEVLRLHLWQLVSLQMLESIDDKWWKFSQALYQQVVYNMILQSHRRQLHIQAIKILEEAVNERKANLLHTTQDLEFDFDTFAEEQMVFHWVKVIEGSVNMPLGGRTISESDLVSAGKAVATLAARHMTAGNVSEALRCQWEFQSLMQSLDRSSCTATHQTIIEISNRTAKTIQGLGQESSALPTGELDARFEELNRFKTGLLGNRTTLDSQLPEPGDTAENSPATENGTVAGKDLEAYALEFQTDMNISRSSFMQATTMFRTSSNMLARVKMGSFLCFSGILTNRFTEVADLSEEAFRVMLETSRPEQDKVLGFSPAGMIVSGWILSNLMIGNIDHSSAIDAFWEEVRAVDGLQRFQIFGVIWCYESIWEPQSSSRVGQWLDRVLQLFERLAGEEILAASKLLYELGEARKHSPQLESGFHSQTSREADRNAGSPSIDVHVKWLQHVSSAITSTSSFFWKLEVLGIMRYCVHEGTKVLFAPLRPGGKAMRCERVYVGHLGLQHLSAATSAARGSMLGTWGCSTCRQQRAACRDACNNGRKRGSAPTGLSRSQHLSSGARRCSCGSSGDSGSATCYWRLTLVRASRARAPMLKVPAAHMLRPTSAERF